MAVDLSVLENKTSLIVIKIQISLEMCWVDSHRDVYTPKKQQITNLKIRFFDKMIYYYFCLLHHVGVAIVLLFGELPLQ